MEKAMLLDAEEGDAYFWKGMLLTCWYPPVEEMVAAIIQITP
jgi:hypothetical protein